MLDLPLLQLDLPLLLLLSHRINITLVSLLPSLLDPTTTTITGFPRRRATISIEPNKKRWNRARRRSFQRCQRRRRRHVELVVRCKHYRRERRSGRNRY